MTVGGGGSGGGGDGGGGGRGGGGKRPTAEEAMWRPTRDLGLSFHLISLSAKASQWSLAIRRFLLRSRFEMNRKCSTTRAKYTRNGQAVARRWRWRWPGGQAGGGACVRLALRSTASACWPYHFQALSIPLPNTCRIPLPVVRSTTSGQLPYHFRALVIPLPSVGHITSRR